MLSPKPELQTLAAWRRSTCQWVNGSYEVLRDDEFALKASGRDTVTDGDFVVANRRGVLPPRPRFRLCWRSALQENRHRLFRPISYVLRRPTRPHRYLEGRRRSHYARICIHVDCGRHCSKRGHLCHHYQNNFDYLLSICLRAQMLKTNHNMGVPISKKRNKEIR